MASKKVRQREITDPTVKAILLRLFPLYYAHVGIPDAGCVHSFAKSHQGKGYGNGSCFRPVHEDNLHISCCPDRIDDSALVWEDIEVPDV